MPIYNFISSILIETNDSVLNKVPVSLEAAAAVNVSPRLQQLWAAETRLWNTDDVDVTFTHVVVDLVACGAGDGSLTDETPHCIYTAFIQKAGVQRQTLVDVCVYWYKEKKKEMKKTTWVWTLSWGWVFTTFTNKDEEVTEWKKVFIKKYRTLNCISILFILIIYY